MGELGGKDRLQLPGQPGFVTLEAGRASRSSRSSGCLPDELNAEVDEYLAALSARMARRLGDAADPLLVSVRSGLKSSMPETTNTVLSTGLSDDRVQRLTNQSGNAQFAWKCPSSAVDAGHQPLLRPPKEMRPPSEQHRPRTVYDTEMRHQ